MMSSASPMNSKNSACTCEKVGSLARRSRVNPCTCDRTLIDVALRIQKSVEGSARQPPVEDLHAADFDDAVRLLDLEARGFRIQYDLAHLKIYRTANMRSIASFASWSTYSLPSCPECPFTQIH